MATTTTIVPSAGPVAGSRSFLSRLREGDEIARMITFLFAASVVLVTVLLVFELWQGSVLARHKFGFNFFHTSVWDPIFEQFGALPFIYGTLVTATIALLIAVPLGIGAAIFLAELAPARVSDTLEFFIDLLAAVPSVIYGILGIFIVVPLMRQYIQPALKHSLGFLPLFQGPRVSVSMLTAGVVLAVMVIPFISAVCTDVFRSVPISQREAALALGATRWEVVRTAVLPYGKSGVFGAILLGVGRALGETIAVAMVIGNRPEIATSLFAPASTLASVIANEFAEATSDLYTSALLELGLVLLVLTMILNAVARLMVRAMSRKFQEARA